MSIAKLVKESVDLGLEFNGVVGLASETDSILKMGKNIFLDETLLTIAESSEPPLPIGVYEKLSLEQKIEIEELVKDVFAKSTSQIEKMSEAFDKIRHLIEKIYNVSYQGQMYQEPYFNLVDLNNRFNLFQEIFICHFSKLLKMPPPKSFLENRITNY